MEESTVLETTMRDSMVAQTLRAACLILTALLSVASAADAQKLLAESASDLATQINATVTKEQKRRIAVLPFRELDGRVTVLGTYISEELATHMFMLGDLEIVERMMLDRILNELQLGQSGLIDPETAKEVGKLAGVDAVVTGSITDLQSFVAVNCRLIDTATGRIFAAAQTKIVKDDDVRKILGLVLPFSMDSSSARPRDGRPAASRQHSISREDTGLFVFEMIGCTLVATVATCEFLATAKDEDREIGWYAGRGYREYSRLIDETGNESRGSDKGRLGSETGPLIRLRLVAGIATLGVVVFEDVRPDAKLASLVELLCFEGSNNKPFAVQFRDIPLVHR